MKSFLVAGFTGDDTSRAAYSGRARRRLAAWLVCWGFQHPRRGAEALSHGFSALQTMVMPLLPYVW